MSTDVELQPSGPVGEPGPGPSAGRANPYVGPRSFAYGETLYGRTRETAELTDLLIAERIVLLYSPSGAGKSSLLAAGLRPELEQRDFLVLPTIRVSHEPTAGPGGSRRGNRYTVSTLLSLAEGRPADEQLPVDDLVALGLDSYLASIEQQLVPDRDPVLVFDQFEELFTLDPTDQTDKAGFLQELGIALRDRGRWALFAMREDFIAQLDPYLALMPKRFATRYRLDVLGIEAAIAAVRSPAGAAGVSFNAEAASRLIDDLRRVRVQRGASVSEEPGPHVEPVQLQVVCRQLWTTLPAGATVISVADVEAVGNVDDALADYYVEQVGRVASSTGTSEREIRTWIDEQLISEQGFRTQALEGPGPNGPAVLRELENAHLLRADRRRGTEWYELAHDRLVPPVVANNAAWREAHLSTLQREAQSWERQSRPAGLLLSGDVLVQAEGWASDHEAQLSPVDIEYLQACRAERERTQREQRASRRNRRLAVVASVVGLVAIGALIAALLAFVNASNQKRDAEEARQLATEALARQQAQVEAGRWLSLGNTSTAPVEKLLSWRNAYLADRAGLDGDLTRKLLTARHYLANPRPYLAASASLGADGRRMARVDETGRIELVDVDAQLTGAAPTVLPLGGEVVQFSPLDGRLAVHAADEGSWTVWDTTTEQEVASLAAETAQALAFSAVPGPIAGISSGTLVLWDASGEPLEPPDMGGEAAEAVALAPDGSRLAAVVAGPRGTALRIWQRTSGAWQAVPLDLPWDASSLAPPAFSPAGDRLAVGDLDADLHVLALTAQGTTDDVLPADPDAALAPIATGFLSDDVLRVVRENGAVETWSAAPAGWEGAEPVEIGPVLAAQLSGDGERILVQDASVARVYDATTGAILLGPDLASIGVTSTGGSAVAQAGGETLEQVAPPDGWRERPERSVGLALSPDGRVLASLGLTPAGSLALGADAAGLPIPCPMTAEPQALLPGQDLTIAIAVSDGAAGLAIASADGVCSWPQAGAEDAANFSPAFGGAAGALDVSPDGALAAAGGPLLDRGLVELIPIGPAAEGSVPVFLDEVVTAVRLSPDAGWVVAGDATGKLVVQPTTGDPEEEPCLIDTQAFAPAVAVDVADGGSVVAVATEKAVSVFEVTWSGNGCSSAETSGFDLFRDEGAVLSIDLDAEASRLRVLESDLYVHELDVHPDAARVADEIRQLADARGWPEPSLS
jgi:hypothetical protein